MSINDYRTLQTLGKGSFGSAMLVQKVKPGAPDRNMKYVAKEINLIGMRPRERLEAKNEILMLKQLHHPNITKYIESFEEAGKLYIVMEYANGGDLFTKVQERKKARRLFTEDEVMFYFTQICLAVFHMHEHKMLHRDIKTQNIFLNKDGVVKLGDFGISTVLRYTAEMRQTQCGTPYYFSPELCRNQAYNDRSDVWALGCVLYEMCTLTHAFDGATMRGLVQKICRGVYPPISTRQYSGALADLIAVMLAVNPKQRPSIRGVVTTPHMRSALLTLQKIMLAATAGNQATDANTAAQLSREDSARYAKKQGDKVHHDGSSPRRTHAEVDNSAPVAVEHGRQSPIRPREKPPHHVPSLSSSPHRSIDHSDIKIEACAPRAPHPTDCGGRSDKYSHSPVPSPPPQRPGEEGGVRSPRRVSAVDKLVHQKNDAGPPRSQEAPKSCSRSLPLPCQEEQHPLQRKFSVDIAAVPVAQSAGNQSCLSTDNNASCTAATFLNTTTAESFALTRSIRHVLGHSDDASEKYQKNDGKHTETKSVKAVDGSSVTFSITSPEQNITGNCVDGSTVSSALAEDEMFYEKPLDTPSSIGDEGDSAPASQTQHDQQNLGPSGFYLDGQQLLLPGLGMLNDDARTSSCAMREDWVVDEDEKTGHVVQKERTDRYQGMRVEALRVYLERHLGDDVFLALYRVIDQIDSSEADDAVLETVQQTLPTHLRRYVPLVAQLILMEVALNRAE